MSLLKQLVSRYCEALMGGYWWVFPLVIFVIWVLIMFRYEIKNAFYQIRRKGRKKKVEKMMEYIRKQLGIKGLLYYRQISLNRYMILKNNEYLGIFDTKLKTFVD